jgi:hypothetical protein
MILIPVMLFAKPFFFRGEPNPPNDQEIELQNSSMSEDNSN